MGVMFNKMQKIACYGIKIKEKHLQNTVKKTRSNISTRVI